MSPWRLALALLAAAPACDEASPREAGFVDHEESRDLDPIDGGKFDGALAYFNPDLIWDDAMFTNTEVVTVAGIQALLEDTPYGKRSFLADEQIGGRPFSEVLVEVAHGKQLNPMLLLVRLQVEKSLVSKANRPGGNAVDFALGCGCPDGQACNESYRGLDKQLDCAAGTLRTHYDASVAGNGAWRMLVAHETLDPQTVTPKSHGTASLYAYTPWVLEGTGGNWLVWNVSRKYIGAMIDAGTWGAPADPIEPEAPTGSCVDHCDSDAAVLLGDGQACFCDAACVQNGDCCGDREAVCGASADDGAAPPPPAASCEGACGSSTAIAVGDGKECYCDVDCVDAQDCCADFAQVCGEPEPPEPAPGSCAQACGSSDPIDVGDGTQCYCDDFCATNGDCCADLDAVCG